MIFKAIQDRFKVKSARKFLEDELKKMHSFSEKKGISSVGCIVDMDEFPKAETFQKLRDALRLKPNAVHIIGFKRTEDKSGMFSIPFVTEKHMGWNGSIENGDFDEFSGREYDVLINYYTDNRLVLQLMTAKVKARIRVGLEGADHALNDLIFDCAMNDYGMFESELVKYMTILNELN